MEIGTIRKADIIAALGFLAASALMAFVVIPEQTAEGQWYGLSPMAFPLVLMGGIALASLGLLIQALLQPHKYKKPQVILSKVQLRNVAIISTVIVLCSLAMEYLGYWVGAPAVIAACMLYMGERQRLRILTTALLPPLIVFLLTRYVLLTPLP